MRKARSAAAVRESRSHGRILFLLWIVAAIACAIALTSCDSGTQATDQATTGSDSAASTDNSQGTAGDGASASAVTYPDTTGDSETDVLVAYFSATAVTEHVAQWIAEAEDGAIFGIEPTERYTEAELDYSDAGSRSSLEHEDENIRPNIANRVTEMENYQVIFLGYPVWFSEAPNIIKTFLEEYDLSGKTIIPFCTSNTSGIGESAKNLEKYAPDAKWETGERFGKDATKETVEQWLSSLQVTGLKVLASDTSGAADATDATEIANTANAD